MIKNEKNKEFFKAGENVGNIIGTVVEVSPSLLILYLVFLWNPKSWI